ncbi:hypothetical protein [Spirosoma endophyticum]|uniref:hypothetical protein n=1 Tax=Spirosoma endophyticum TaxID=662367 RepID=UPI001160C7FE|nr:hypothetical protein [Spirosoma endophyticum]
MTDRIEKTISGFVKYYDWDKSPKSIEFGEDSSGSMNTFPLRTIRKLSIKDGPLYESLYLKVPYYSTDPVLPGSNIIDHTDSTYRLAELLLDSEPVKFYRFFDNNNHLRFLITKYDSLILLDDIQVQLIKSGTVFKFESHVYRKKIRTALYECPTLNTDNTQYTEVSLINLLKDYLSFCRIDSKIYLEQKELGKAMIGIGPYASYWNSAYAQHLVYGLNVQVLLPRRLHNVFIMLNVGKASQETVLGARSAIIIGIYGGQYFGRRAIQGKIYTGLSTLFGAFDTGVGLSYRKMISMELRYPVFSGLFSGFREQDSLYIQPLINLSATIPIGRPASR